MRTLETLLPLIVGILVAAEPVISQQVAPLIAAHPVATQIVGGLAILLAGLARSVRPPASPKP